MTKQTNKQDNHLDSAELKIKTLNNERRAFLQTAMSACVLLSTPLASPLAAALSAQTTHSIGTATPKKLVWIMLRGAMDSLHAVVPAFDPDYFAYRESILGDIKSQLLPLDDGYALHPAFKHLHTLYKKKQFSPVVAVANAYRERSHFHAQDHMESGLNEIDHENGWMARALQQYKGQGLAISRSVPIALRQNGENNANTWYPSSFKPADDDLLNRLELLYEDDAQLSQLLQQAKEQRDNPNMLSEGKSRPKFSLLASRCGEILQHDKSINCAMLELGGWDTHNNQSSRLDRQFSQLDEGIAALQKGLGDTWNDTLVIVSTEFGRTVKLNGTGGTDHGTASCLLLLGGALNKGGQVLGEWPGLAQANLFEERDLMPTSDLRTWIAEHLQDHWQLSSQDLQQIFPDAALPRNTRNKNKIG